MNISAHLTLLEVTKSQTAIQKGIENTPTDEHLFNLQMTAKYIFEPLRVHFNVPIGISSGYRGVDLNKAVGGSKTSDHCFGRALDLDADIFGKLKNVDIFNYIKNNLVFKQLIWEFGTATNPDWVHVSYETGNNKGEILKAIKVNNQTKYIKI